MFLGIDLGTSGIKLVLLQDDHQVRAVTHAPLTVSRPQPLWSEQSPEDWWQALEQAMAEMRLLAPNALAAVQAIGLSGQMHGAVVMDGQHQVLRPAILWNDGRAFAQCAQLEAICPDSRTVTGNLAMPGFTAPKLLWLKDHEPDLFRQIQRVLLPKDWLRWRMCGEAVSDMSDASGTLWLDVAQRDWSDQMLAACQLDRSHMPRLVEGSEVSGLLHRSLAERWGLGTALGGRVLIAGGGGDNAASAVGMGATRAGQGFVSLGTSGVVFLVTDQFRPAPQQAVHAFAHALPHTWHQMSVMLSAASAITWASQLTGQPDEAAFVGQASTLRADQRARAPMFLPYLAGERTPHNNPNASGALVGLRAEHGLADVAYAVVEGVGFGLRDGLQAMRDAQGVATTATSGQSPLTLVGGGARSDAWAQLLANQLQTPLARAADASAAAALGAARLAWLATGADGSAVCRAPLDVTAFEPQAQEAALLDERYERFRALAPVATMLV